MLDFALILPFLLVFPPGAYSAIGISLMFSITITSIFYMVAYVSQHPTMFMLAKEELAALILSIVLVCAWGMIEGFLSVSAYQIICIPDPQLCQHFVPTGTGNLYAGQLNIADSSLNVVRVKLLTEYGTFYMFEVLMGFLSTLSFPIGSFLPAVNLISLSIMPFDGLSLLSNAHTIIVESIGYLAAVIMAKQWFLIFAKEAIPKILLPLGLVLRAFPFFRSTGSSIIAICIVIYFVYPITIIGSNYLIFDVYFQGKAADFVYNPQHVGFYQTGTGPTTIAELEAYEDERQKGEEKMKELMKLFTAQDSVRLGVQESCGTGVFSLFCHVWNFFKKVVDVARDIVSSIWKIFTFMWSLSGDLFSSIINKGLPTSAAIGLYDFIIDEVVNMSQFMVLVVIMSLIEIIITITMYRNIALMIGGEVEIIGLSKLI